MSQDSYDALLARAEQAASQRQFAEAITLYEQALALRPGDAQTLLQLSYVHSLSGRYRRARRYAMDAWATGTHSPKALMELLPRLRTFNEIPAMRDCVQRMMPVSRMSIPVLLKAAAHLSYANLPDEAIGLLDEARRADPDYPPTLLARTQVLTYLGRFREAEQDVSHALKRAPEIAQGWWLQAFLRRQQAGSHHVNSINAELHRPNRRPEDIALLAFALHKELDDLGRPEEAWNALMLGCRAKRSTLSYSTAETSALFDELIAFSPADHPPARRTDTVPIFIVGMHRSGTTLLEQMLDGAPDVRGIGELYDFTSAMRDATDYHCRGVVDIHLVRRAASADLAAAGRRYLQGIAWRLNGEQFFTDKLPSNFLNLGFIAPALPQAKILHMVRDPVETCFSNLRELFSDANPYSYDLSELAAYHQQYQRLMEHWHRRFPGRIMDVDYARLVREPEKVLREVCEFCGLSYDPRMLQFDARKRGVVTASAVQVREGIQARETPKWAPYAAMLQPMASALARH
ncbi:sulfotransferase [Pseudoxanthomonas sp. X-1]|uniref:tetratricopeptide repeat-containing sulfotransferase family protein n=1 Tax=Pseudoxanthomonas sp. X-1 TaxID=2571115 RepID=UPI00110B0273|nr:sulfotransferase [Pseudoxanthomonas sp. X-1]TMN17145.1 hypothetical protein FF950_17465 [Pseudoxanthomonas sp. X-1]UAY76189.1 sulfotransferase [Pseudoxanthomonas sp. X-1]